MFAGSSGVLIAWKALVSRAMSRDFKDHSPQPDGMSLFLPSRLDRKPSRQTAGCPLNSAIMAPDDLSAIASLLESEFSKIAINASPEEAKMISELMEKKFAETGGK